MCNLLPSGVEFSVITDTYDFDLMGMRKVGSTAAPQVSNINTMKTKTGLNLIQNTLRPWLSKLAPLGFAGLVWLGVTGCQTAQPAPREFSEVKGSGPQQTNVIVLQEGDSVRITFPGADNLNTVQTIRRDGRITLPVIGEFKAAGLTPPDMEKQLVELYGPQLQTKQVSVAVESSAFVFYVTGAVLRPGKVITDRPINVLTAAMEAGGFDYTKANLKAVRVIRTQDGKTVNFNVDVSRILNGQDNNPFALKPGDIIYVPERFNWF
jgi:polysaccharide export outer membrane protein